MTMRGLFLGMGLWWTMTAAAGAGVRIQSVRAPVEWRSWSLKATGSSDQTLSQATVPVVLTVRLGPATNTVVSTAFARSGYSQDGSTSHHLSGLTDTRLALFHRLPSRGVLLHGGLNLPTGKTTLTLEELAVASWIAHPLLGMPIKQPGRGLGFGAGCSWAKPLRPGMQLGLGAGFDLPGAYTLTEGHEEFSPTLRLSMTAGLELSNPKWASNRIRATVRASYRTYGTDQVGGKDAFQEGDQLELVASITSELGRYRLYGIGQWVGKYQNTIYSRDGAEVLALRNNAGDGALLRLSVQRRLGQRISGGLLGEWRWFGKSDLDWRNGDVFAFGPTGSLSMGGHVWLILRAQTMTGTLGADAPTVDVSGHVINVHFAWRPDS